MNSALVDDQGEMWIMLMHSTASYCAATGQRGSCTSSASGASMLVSPDARMRALMASRDAASGSGGCQRVVRNAAAKEHTGRPEAEAISSTVPDPGRTVSSNGRVGSLVPSAAGEVSNSLDMRGHCI